MLAATRKSGGQQTACLQLPGSQALPCPCQLFAQTTDVSADKRRQFWEEGRGEEKVVSQTIIHATTHKGGSVEGNRRCLNTHSCPRWCPMSVGKTSLMHGIMGEASKRERAEQGSDHCQQMPHMLDFKRDPETSPFMAQFREKGGGSNINSMATAFTPPFVLPSAMSKF